MTREEAIKCLKTIEILKFKDSSKTYFFEDIKKCIDMAIEALEQKPETGHWIMTNDYYTGAYGSIDYVKCSCCHEDSLEEGNYCPNCGAKMESEEE